MPSAIEGTCPTCSAPASGRYCAGCGVPLSGATCSLCKEPLTPGAGFCHNCGAAAGASTASPGKGGALPWAIAGLAMLTMLAMLAGRGFNVRRGSTVDAPQNALPQAGLDDRAPAGVDPGQAAPRAPDISQLSPTERADRLFNRVMLLHSQGKADSVQFFAPMALNAYQMMGSLSADQRYDMGRIGEVAGAIPLARAQADSILMDKPNHLLGLILAARMAGLSGDSSAMRGYGRRLIAAAQSGMKKPLDEYVRHQDDITVALAEARRNLASR